MVTVAPAGEKLKYYYTNEQNGQKLCRVPGIKNRLSTKHTAGTTIG
jgi:hypothetical protein